MDEKLTLGQRVLRWTLGVGAAMAIFPAVWGAANYIAYNDHEDVIGDTLVCGDVDGFFSHTLVRHDLTTGVTRTQDYFFLRNETTYTDLDSDYLVDIVEQRSSTCLGEPHFRRYERGLDYEENQKLFDIADSEYERQLVRFRLP